MGQKYVSHWASLYIPMSMDKWGYNGRMCEHVVISLAPRSHKRCHNTKTYFTTSVEVVKECYIVCRYSGTSVKGHSE